MDFSVVFEVRDKQVTNELFTMLNCGFLISETHKTITYFSSILKNPV